MSPANYEAILNALRGRERDITLDLFRAQGVAGELREELDVVQTAIKEVQREHFTHIHGEEAIK